MLDLRFLHSRRIVLEQEGAVQNLIAVQPFSGQHLDELGDHGLQIARVRARQGFEQASLDFVAEGLQVGGLEGELECSVLVNDASQGPNGGGRGYQMSLC